jgi:hypothetical protein
MIAVLALVRVQKQSGNLSRRFTQYSSHHQVQHHIDASSQHNMPLPSHSLVVNGGCNCGAIRYKVSIPEIEKRPLHPSSTSSSEAHLPFVVIDHCNDCRRAIGGILPLWICSPIHMVTSSVVLRSTASLPADPSKRKDSSVQAEARTAWLLAADVFTPGPTSNDTFLTSFDSSEGRRRFFCGRCGTNLAYVAFPMPEGWPDMLDIILGTICREDLEGDALQPERQLWWDCGIDWIQKMATQGVGSLPKHPSYNVDTIIPAAKD